MQVFSFVSKSGEDTFHKRPSASLRILLRYKRVPLAIVPGTSVSLFRHLDTLLCFCLPCLKAFCGEEMEDDFKKRIFTLLLKAFTHWYDFVSWWRGRGERREEKERF